MAKVHLRVQHSHPYQQPTAHSTHGNHHFYGASQHTNQQPSMNGTNSYHQQLGSIPNPQQKQNLSTPMTTTVHPFYVQSQQQQQQVQQPQQQQQQFQQPQQSQHSQYHLQNGSTTSTQPPQSTNGENMYYSNNNNGNSENTTMHKVVKPIARRSVPGDEPIRSPDYNYYRSVVSNRTPYRSHGFLLHVSSKLGEVQRTTVTCPFMNKTAIVLANKRRKTTQRPTFALSVHLLKTYKNINTLYYAEKRKRDAIQKQNAIRSNQQKILPKAIATQPSQQLYPTSAFVQQQQQQQQQLQMQYYPQVQPLVYQTQYPYPPQMQPQLLPQNYLQQQAINSSLFHYNQPPTSIIPNPPLYNDGYDDENGNYVVQINEELANRYIVQENLGKGSFGVVVKAYDTYKGELVAVKVIKNKSQFYEQAKVEIAILSDLQQKDKNKEFNVVQMKHFFEWRSHLCIVFELLSYNLYDLLKYTNFKGVSLKLIRKFAQQLLYTLYFLSRSDVNIIHCDLKPENILLKHHRKSLIKVIDFGSSCYINKKMFKYIQSRFYRSPEVLLGLPYSTTIDMWSFGCILVEMHTGLPLFDGKNERDQLWKIIQVLGMPPRWMIEKSPKKDMFFKFNQATQSYVLNNPNYVPNSRSLHDIIGVNTHGPEGRRANQEGHTRTDYLQFYDLVTHILQFDPNARALPIDALKHPFFPIHSHASPSSDGPRMSTSPESPIGQYYPTPRPIQQQHHHQQHQQQQVLPQEQQVYQTAPHHIQHMDVNHINHAHYPQNPYYQIPPYYYHPTNPRTQIG